MARLARVEVFAPDEIAVVHVMNRTVRRCFLLGNDPLTGRNFDHRKEWIEAELRRLAASFGIDVLCHAIMSNHFHLILRSRPDVVAAWDDAEIARRWLSLCPLRREADGQPAEPSDAELNLIRNDPARLATIRSRLSDISWWMRLLSQTVAQRANRDDREVGKFWQARYRAVRLLDETAILACAAYVDLNPIRAAIAETLEASHFTSVQRRIEALQEAVGAVEQPEPATSATPATSAAPATSATSETSATTGACGDDPARIEMRSPTGSQVARLPAADRHLAPLSIDELRDPIGECCSTSGCRASDKGFLPMSLAAYLELLDWTARNLRSDKRGATPASARPIFERLGMGVGATWCHLVQDFGRLFYTVAGQPHEIDARRSRSGHRHKAKPQARELLTV